jgi:putative iron-regulated protein
LHDLLKEIDQVLASKLANQVDASVGAAGSIPQPFDQAILGNNQSPGRIAIKNSIKAFQNESDLIAAAAKVLSINLNL